MMETSPPDTWTLRIVLAEGQGVATGVPVTLLDAQGDPAGRWASDAAGLVSIPRQPGDHVRVRVGLRNEEPQTLAAAALDAGPVDVVAPGSALLPAPADRQTVARSRVALSTERAERPETPGHVVRFTRLLVAPQPGSERIGPAAGRMDLVEAGAAPDVLRHGIIAEFEQYWQSTGYATGDLLYSAPVLPGEEVRLAVVDQRWDGSAAGRVVDAAARVMAEGGGPVLPPLALVQDARGRLDLAAAIGESHVELAGRAEQAAHTLRRRPLAVRELTEGVPPGTTAQRTFRNPHADRTLTFAFFEPLERFRVFTRTVRTRPALLVPFHLPTHLGLPTVRQFGGILRRALLDPDLAPDLERILADQEPAEPEPAARPPVSELRLVVQRDAARPGPDLRQVWCFLHVDDVRYTVHFFPVDAPGHGVSAPAAPDAYWIGAIRLADFHQQPLRYPGSLALQNGSGAMLGLQVLHVEGRSGERWVRLHTLQDVVLPARSQLQLATLADLVAAPGVDRGARRLLLHLQANLTHYTTAILAQGDAGLRAAALARLTDGSGRSLAALVENQVVGTDGTLVAFPLRVPEMASAAVRAALAEFPGRSPRPTEEVSVTLPLPGVLLSVQAGDPWVAGAEREGASEERRPAGATFRRGRAS